MHASVHLIPAIDGDTAVSSRLDSVIDRAVEERRLVGAVVLVGRGGRLVYRHAAGFADRESRLPMTDANIFLLASIAKLVVATAAMLLVERGELRVEDPVTRWLPQFAPRLPSGEAPVITIHHLLTHSAGLTYAFMDAAGQEYRRLGVSDGIDAPGPSLAENLHRIAAAPLVYAPGSGWCRSLSSDVLGAVLEAICRRTLPEVIAELVTDPLEIRDMGFRIVDPSRLVTHYADGSPEPVRMSALHTVRYGSASIQFAPRRLFDPRAYPSGGAGIAGTAHDVFRFLEALRQDGALLQPHTIARMMTAHVGPHVQAEGPGWGCGYGGAVLVDPVAAASPQGAGSFQWGAVYGHKVFVDRMNQLTVVALTNTAFEGMSGRFTIELRDAVYGAPLRC